MKVPFFSVIIPMYNRANSIAKAIESVLNQTFQDFELIIVDDCSIDNSAAIVKQFQFQDSRIKYVQNQINLERCISRNRGIQAATGKYICFLDSDDYHLVFHFETFHQKIIQENYPKAFLFSSAWNETEEGERTERVCPVIGTMDLYHYFLNYTVNPQRWCIERSVANSILFDPEIIICEDLDFSLRVVHAGIQIIQIPIQTTVYVASKDSFTHGDPKKWEKELFYLNRMFKKPEFKKKLRKNDVNRLLSIRYYHLASKSNRLNQSVNTIKFIFKSFYLCPLGYKKGVVKDLLILFIVTFPGVNFLKKLFR